MKAKIQETQGDDFPATSMNIIYQGKVRGRSRAAPYRACPCVPMHPSHVAPPCPPTPAWPACPTMVSRS